MYQGDNPIAQQSINWLTEAVFLLMKKKPYCDIRIKDICNKAGLSRQTFYNVFDEKDDIMRYFLRKKLKESVIRPGRQREKMSLEELLKFYSKCFSNNIDLYRIYIKHDLEDMLSEEISLIVSEGLENVFSTTVAPMKAYYISYLSGAFSSSLFYWLKDKNPVSSDSYCSFLYSVIHENYLDELIKSR